MHINKIFIKGYKTLHDFKLHDLNKGLNVFIGENNVGKSNILKALDIFFNKEVISENDRTILLDYTLSNNKREELTIELEFSNEMPLTRYSGVNDNNRKRIIAKFNQNNKKQFFYYYQNSDIKEIGQAELQKYLPNFIYVKDLNEEKKFNIETLFEVFPELTHEDMLEVETYANSLLKFSWDKNVFISIKSIADEIKVVVADEYGSSNEFKDKSSGIQQVVFMSLFLGLNLIVKSDKVIIALEEPESNLHLKLQKQLFALLRMTSKKAQIFLSTHSAAFVDKMNSKEVFHVVRNQKGQTEVNTNVMHNNWYTLRMDLGLSINDSLLFGQNNLIVEGISEKVLLPFLIDNLNKKGDIKFSNSDVNIISAEGAPNMPYFVKLISELVLSNIVILDKDKAGDNAKKGIIKSMPNLENNIIILEKESYKEIEFEDLFSDEIIAEALSNAYGTKVTVDDIADARKACDYSKFSHMIEKLEAKMNINNKFDSIGKHKFARQIRYTMERKSIFTVPDEIINLTKEIEERLESI